MRTSQPTISRHSLISTVTAVTERFAHVARSADPLRAVPATPGWTVRDVAAHLITAVRRYADGPAGGMERVADPADLPALNERLLRQQDWPALPDLLRELQERTRGLLTQVGAYGDAQPAYMFNGDRWVRADQSLGILLGELLVHGADVASLTGQPWPVRADDAEMVLYGMEFILPGWVHPGRGRRHTAAYDIRVRGDAHRHAWAFRDGELDCHAAPGTPFDCHLSASPAPLLMVMYRRESPWRAALTGQATAWGRRPWLALSLPGRFHPP